MSLNRAAFIMFNHPREGDLIMDAPSWTLRRKVVVNPDCMGHGQIEVASESKGDETAEGEGRNRFPHKLRAIHHQLINARVAGTDATTPVSKDPGQRPCHRPQQIPTPQDPTLGFYQDQISAHSPRCKHQPQQIGQRTQ